MAQKDDPAEHLRMLATEVEVVTTLLADTQKEASQPTAQSPEEKERMDAAKAEAEARLISLHQELEKILNRVKRMLVDMQRTSEIRETLANAGILRGEQLNWQRWTDGG